MPLTATSNFHFKLFFFEVLESLKIRTFLHLHQIYVVCTWSLVLPYNGNASSILLFNCNGHLLPIYGKFSILLQRIRSLLQRILIPGPFQMNYAAGYGMAVITYVQLFYMCELGDSIEVLFEAKLIHRMIENSRKMFFLIGNVGWRIRWHDLWFQLV